MKKTLCFTLILILLSSSTVFAQRKKDRSKKIIFKITLIEGLSSNCLTKRKGEKKWRRAKIKDRLKEGDHIKTLEAVRVEMKSRDGVVMRLNQKSRFTVKKLKKEKKGIRAKMKLWLGKGWFKIKKVTQRRIRFETETPSAVAGVYGTTYRVNVGDDKSTSVKVYNGAVKVGSLPYEVSKPTQMFGAEPHEVSGPQEVQGPKEVTKKEWDVIVTTMQQVTVSFDNKNIEKSKFDAEEDEKEEWVRWNKLRDSELDWEE